MIVLYAGWNPTSQAYEAKPLGSDWQQRTHSMQRGPRPPSQHVSSKSFFYQTFPSSAKQENLDVSVLPSCSLTSSCVVHKDVKSAKCLHDLVHGCCYSDMFWKKYEVKYFMDYVRGQNKTKSNSHRPNKSQARHVFESQQHEDCKRSTSVAKRSIWRDNLIKGCLVSSIVAKVKGQHKNLKSQCFNINMIDRATNDCKYFNTRLFHLTSTSSLGNTLVFDFVKKLASPEIFYPGIWNPFWGRDLAVIATLAPFLTASMARAAPIPVLAPVTQTTWSFSLTKTNVDAMEPYP